jgi:hypothetical protein
MSESNHASPLSYASGAASRRTSLVQIGGSLGIAACIIGLAIFLTACAGFNAAFTLSLIPLALALPGLIITIVGGFTQKDMPIEDTAAIAAMFVTIAGTIGGLLEVAVWRGWPIFAR